MSAVDGVWRVGRLTLGTATQLATRLRVHGKERVPPEGGVVLAMNHFSWLDPLCFGVASPRTIYYMAKIELHRIPALGSFVRAFGTYSVRRGESDREAIRLSRELVQQGRALGLFVEGTRQAREPGPVKPGAALIALQETVPVIPGAVHGTQFWRPTSPHPVSVAWGEPLDFSGLAPGASGYREASVEIGRAIRTLWEFLVDAHEAGRPRGMEPPTGAAPAQPETAPRDTAPTS